MNRKAFFDEVRGRLFAGRLNQSQVDGMNVILDFWETPPVKPEGSFATNWAIRNTGWLAYMLATTFHETAQTMQPIREFGSDSRFRLLYCNRSDLGNGPGNGGLPGDGPRFCGRGFVQLTGRRNYTLMTPIVQRFHPEAPNFTLDPSAVMITEYAAVVMFFGMFEGTFTGRALKHFIGDPAVGQTVDFLNARRVINGLDRAALLAAQADQFMAALKAAGATSTTTAPPTTTPDLTFTITDATRVTDGQN